MYQNISLRLLHLFSQYDCKCIGLLQIFFPVVCHTLTGRPTASADTQQLYRNMDISKFSKRSPELQYIKI